MAAASTVEKGIRDTRYEWFDNAGHTLPLSCEPGDVKWKKPKPNRVIVRDRGRIVGSLEGESQTGDISFTLHMTQYTNSDSNNPTAIDVMDGNAGWTSTGGRRHRGTNITGFREIIDGVVNGDDEDHGREAQIVAWDWETVNGDPNVISVTGIILDDDAPTLTGP